MLGAHDAAVLAGHHRGNCCKTGYLVSCIFTPLAREISVFSLQKGVKSAHFVLLHRFQMNTVFMHLFPHSLKVAPARSLCQLWHSLPFSPSHHVASVTGDPPGCGPSEARLQRSPGERDPFRGEAASLPGPRRYHS